MKPLHAIEAHILNLVEAARRGAAPDPSDGLTSVFRSWPQATPFVARRLAACANAARGRDILWLVGFDSTRPRAKGADPLPADAWIARISEHFEGIAPRISAIQVPINDKPRRVMVALQVETGRAPFVVRGSGRRLETPWFDAGAVRSARRLELVQMLSPLQELPAFEILEADLSVYKNPHVSAAARATFRWTLDAAVYVMPQADARVVIPLHRCRGTVLISGSAFRNEATDVSLTADKNSPAIRITESAALIEGLGRFFIYCCGSTRDPDLLWQNPAELIFDCTPAGANRAAVAVAPLRPEPPLEANQTGRWKL